MKLLTSFRMNKRPCTRAAMTGTTPLLGRATERTIWLAILLCLAAACSASAQSYSIDWHKVAGGGGTSTNGQYCLSGAIGQPEAGGPMTNGQYAITGGFWVLPQAVQVFPAPTLAIAPASPGHATISWLPNSPGFVLQETWSLSPANWTNSVSGSINPVTIPTVNTAKYFRLKKP